MFRTFLLLFLTLGVSFSSGAQIHNGFFSKEENRLSVYITVYDKNERPIISPSVIDSLVTNYTNNGDSVGLFFSFLAKSIVSEKRKIDNLTEALKYIPLTRYDQLLPYSQLAEAYIQNNSLEENLQLLSNASSNLNDPYIELLIQFFRTEILAKDGEVIAAKKSLNESLELLNTLNTDNRLSKTFKLLAHHAQVKVGLVANDLTSTRDHIEKILPLATELGDSVILFNSYGNLAYILMNENKYREAIDYGKKDFYFSVRQNNTPSVYGIAGILVQSYSSINKPDSADIYYNIAIDLIEDISLEFTLNFTEDILLNYINEFGNKDDLLVLTQKLLNAQRNIFEKKADSNLKLYKAKNELRKYKNELELKNDIIKLNEQNIILLTGLVLLALFTLVFLYLSFRSKSKRNIELIKKQNEIDTQNEELKSQNEQLHSQKNKIEELYGYLEKDYDENSQELLRKNKALTEYAFHNSHHIRAPLSRLLGLCNLINNHEISKEEKFTMIHELNNQALELDQMIKEMNRILNEES